MEEEEAGSGPGRKEGRKEGRKGKNRMTLKTGHVLALDRKREVKGSGRRWGKKKNKNRLRRKL